MCVCVCVCVREREREREREACACQMMRTRKKSCTGIYFFDNCNPFDASRKIIPRPERRTVQTNLFLSFFVISSLKI